MTDFDRSARPPPDRTAVFLQLGLGVFSTFVLHAVVGGLFWLASLVGAALNRGWVPGGSPVALVLDLPGTLLVAWAFSVGLSQVLYVGPAALVALFVRRPIALGLLIGAAITFLLQSACYGLVAVFVLPGLSGMH